MLRSRIWSHASASAYVCMGWKVFRFLKVFGDVFPLIRRAGFHYFIMINNGIAFIPYVRVRALWSSLLKMGINDLLLIVMPFGQMSILKIILALQKHACVPFCGTKSRGRALPRWTSLMLSLDWTHLNCIWKHYVIQSWERQMLRAALPYFWRYLGRSCSCPTFSLPLPATYGFFRHALERNLMRSSRGKGLFWCFLETYSLKATRRPLRIFNDFQRVRCFIQVIKYGIETINFFP